MKLLFILCMDSLDFSISKNLLKEVIFKTMLCHSHKDEHGEVFLLQHLEMIVCPRKATRSNIFIKQMTFKYMWEQGQNPCPSCPNDAISFG